MTGFSRRELQVVVLLATGSTTQQIAEKLRIKLAVVHNYIYFVYRKKNFNTRPDLIKWAKEYGLDDPSMVAPGTLENPVMNVSGMTGFSRRELRVVALLAIGSTTKQIAEKLRIKLAVVHNYICFVYRKNNFNTRPDLIKWAKAYGLDDPNMVAPGTRYMTNQKMPGVQGKRMPVSTHRVEPW